MGAADDLATKKKELADCDAQACIDATKATLVYQTPPDIVKLRTIDFHKQKVYDCAFSGDSNHVATGSQDNMIMVTNIVNGMKTCKPVSATFIMGIALNNSAKMLAHGGMDNTITLTDLSDGLNPTTKKQFADVHEGYISRIKFATDSKLLSVSGDGTASLIDIGQGKCVSKFVGHTGDCNSISYHATAPDLFATGSTDNTVRVWDMRTPQFAVRTFKANAEVNAVALFPSGKSVVCGNDNGNHQLFDMGSGNLVDTGKPKNKKIRIMSIEVSSSGRYIYAGQTTGHVMIADAFCVNKWKQIKCHEAYVCSMSMAPDGAALATSGYDSNCNIWTGGVAPAS